MRVQLSFTAAELVAMIRSRHRDVPAEVEVGVPVHDGSAAQRSIDDEVLVLEWTTETLKPSPL